MGSNEDLNRCWNVVRTAMLTHWDPIGISYLPEALDEYDSYAWEASRMLIANTATQDNLSTYGNLKPITWVSIVMFRKLEHSQFV